MCIPSNVFAFFPNFLLSVDRSIAIPHTSTLLCFVSFFLSTWEWGKTAASNYTSHLAKGGDIGLIISWQFHHLRQLWCVGKNFWLQLTTFHHQALFVSVWFFQGAQELFILHSKLFQTLLSHELLQHLPSREKWSFGIVNRRYTVHAPVDMMFSSLLARNLVRVLQRKYHPLPCLPPLLPSPAISRQNRPAVNQVSFEELLSLSRLCDVPLPLGSQPWFTDWKHLQQSAAQIVPVNCNFQGRASTSKLQPKPREGLSFNNLSVVTRCEERIARIAKAILVGKQKLWQLLSLWS